MDVISLWFVLAYVLYAECIAGVIVNVIIVTANIIKWKTMKSLNTGDKILSSLATSICLYLSVSFLIYLSSIFHLQDDKDQLFIFSLLFVSTFLHFTNLWFATVLCVFYCVKITSYSWKFFIFLKTKISTLVPWFLLASMVISISSSLPFGLGYNGIQVQNLTNVSMGNMNISRDMEYEDQLQSYEKSKYLLLIISCPPFVVFCVVGFLLLHSLWMHIRRMKSSGSGFRSPNLESHFKAVKSMGLFLVLETVYFLVASYSYAACHGNITGYWIAIIVTCSPPVLHSLYIISSNNELKKTFVSMFHVLKCCAQV
ncbi:taste receptor type 2 member 39-like [Engystomops pustulosus]|uniref:taste receptor type 2 member 39-like n=1 Tax=Engystomops pustulosus TaxID=76066 RepID=UPI003AFA1896